MHGASVKRIFSVPDAQEAGCLLKGLWPEARDLPELLPRPERAVVISEFDDFFCKLRAQSRYIGEQFFAGGIHLNPHAVHAADHDVIEAPLQGRLVDIVLVLSDADRLRVYFHQFRKGVHQPSADRYRAPHCYILVREFFTRCFGSGIYRGAALVHHHDRDILRQADASHKGLCLSACGPVSYRDRLYPQPSAEVFDLRSRL